MKSNPIWIAPSVLAADFCNMGAEVKKITAAGADAVHCDVMDGLFVPNISFGPQMVSEIRKHTNLPLDVHLMVSRPERYIETFVNAGADYITVHYEATSALSFTLDLIKSYGKKCGIVISPDTKAEAVFDYLDKADMVLVMSVYPGFGGQKFIQSALDKLQAISAEIKRRKLKTRLEIDGGVGSANIAQIKAAGADTIVAGSSVFKAENIAEAIAELRNK